MKVAAATVALAGLAIAAPAPESRLAKRDNIDATIFNYALTLEHLEATFYLRGLEKFNAGQFANAAGNAQNFFKNLQHISKDENTHVTVLTAALKAAGAPAVAVCKYDFSAALASPEAFIATAAVLESIGTAAYAGAANLITNKQYLTEAASILAVEARHTAYLNSVEAGHSPFPQPFENALSFNQVYSLAAPMIKSCPSSNPALPVKAFPKLTSTQPNVASYSRGSQFRAKLGSKVNLKSLGTVYCAWPLSSGNIFSQAFKTGDNSIRCVIPKGEFGPAGTSFVVITSSQGTISDSNTITGPAIVEVRPPYLQ